MKIRTFFWKSEDLAPFCWQREVPRSFRHGSALMRSVHCLKGHYFLRSQDHPAPGVYITFLASLDIWVHGPYSSALFCNFLIGKSTIQRPGWCIMGSKNILKVLDLAPAQAAGVPLLHIWLTVLSAQPCSSTLFCIHILFIHHLPTTPHAITGKTCLLYHFEWMRWWVFRWSGSCAVIWTGSQAQAVWS